MHHKHSPKLTSTGTEAQAQFHLPLLIFHHQFPYSKAPSPQHTGPSPQHKHKHRSKPLQAQMHSQRHKCTAKGLYSSSKHLSQVPVHLKHKCTAKGTNAQPKAFTAAQSTYRRSQSSLQSPKAIFHHQIHQPKPQGNSPSPTRIWTASSPTERLRLSVVAPSRFF